MRICNEQVYVAQSLDREIEDSFTLTVTATDGKFTANTTVNITVLDVNGEYSINCQLTVNIIV